MAPVIVSFHFAQFYCKIFIHCNHLSILNYEKLRHDTATFHLVPSSFCCSYSNGVKLGTRTYRCFASAMQLPLPLSSGKPKRPPRPRISGADRLITNRPLQAQIGWVVGKNQSRLTREDSLSKFYQNYDTFFYSALQKMFQVLCHFCFATPVFASHLSGIGASFCWR